MEHYSFFNSNKGNGKHFAAGKGASDLIHSSNSFNKVVLAVKLSAYCLYQCI